MITLDELIQNLKVKLLQGDSLEIFAYFNLSRNREKLIQTNTQEFTGEIEKIAILSYSGKFAFNEDIDKVVRKLENVQYKRHQNLFGIIGLYLQDILNDTRSFERLIEEWFDSHSIKHKFLIAKFFPIQFEEKFKRYLQTQIDNKEAFALVLRHIYLEIDINKSLLLSDFIKEIDNLDIIDLILLEELQNIAAIGYSRHQEKLFKDILWCANEIQSKHKMYGNKEDQYNSHFQSLLTAKEFRTEPQTQRGESLSAKQYGELDIAIFTKENLFLSIFEAFVITAIDKEYITNHLKKLSENYDPNGLRDNYAVIYAKNDRFSEFWERYKEFVPTIDYQFKLVNPQIEDITYRHQQYSTIRIGVTQHINRGYTVQVYHLFMDMNFR